MYLTEYKLIFFDILIYIGYIVIIKIISVYDNQTYMYKTQKD